jgi:hypothetical protein
MGCGRKAATGLTQRGRPRDTCCRGCALGGDHDPTCGCIKARTPVTLNVYDLGMIGGKHGAKLRLGGACAAGKRNAVEARNHVS